jgi:hypothetical protein
MPDEDEKESSEKPSEKPTKEFDVGDGAIKSVRLIQPTELPKVITPPPPPGKEKKEK